MQNLHGYQTILTLKSGPKYEVITGVIKGTIYTKEKSSGFAVNILIHVNL